MYVNSFMWHQNNEVIAVVLNTSSIIMAVYLLFIYERVPSIVGNMMALFSI